MKRLKTLIILSLACLPGLGAGTAPQRIAITGQWDPDLPGHFISATTLVVGETYTIRNSTSGTIYVWLLSGRTPSSYFPLMSGGATTFSATVGQFDLYNLSALKNVSLVRVQNDQGQ